MRELTKDDLDAVSGGKSVWESIASWFSSFWGEDKSMPVVTITGTRMTPAEKDAYDLNERIVASRTYSPGCDITASITTPLSNGITSDFGATGPIPAAKISQTTAGASSTVTVACGK